MRFLVSKLWFAWALVFWAAPTVAQTSPPSVTAQLGEFFSGFVVSYTSTEITVDRKGLGKEAAATKTFSIDPATKIEGSLKTKAHVTVKFVSSESGAHAVHIIVR